MGTVILKGEITRRTRARESRSPSLSESIFERTVSGQTHSLSFSLSLYSWDDKPKRRYRGSSRLPARVRFGRRRTNGARRAKRIECGTNGTTGKGNKARQQKGNKNCFGREYALVRWAVKAARAGALFFGSKSLSLLMLMPAYTGRSTFVGHTHSPVARRWALCHQASSLSLSLSI